MALGIGGIQHFGRGKVAENTFQLDLRHGLDTHDKVVEFEKRQTQAGHPCVEFQVHGDRFATSDSRYCVGNGLHVGDARHSRSKSATQRVLFFTTKRTHENEDATSDPSIAQSNAFVGGSYAKPTCAFLFESQCAGFGSVSVGVAFDYSADRDLRTDVLLQDTKVVAES